MYRDPALVVDAERFRNGANTHWLTGTLHRYFNAGTEKYKHLFTPESIDQIEMNLRTFVSRKGIGREMTKEEVDAVYKRLGWKH